MKIIYENCGVKNYMKEIHRHSWSYEKKAWKIQAGGIRTLDLCDTGAALYQYWANKPTWSRSLNWFVINLWKDDDEVMNIWKSYMRTAGWRIKWKKITGRQVYVIAKVSNYSWQKLISSLLYFDFQRYLRVTLIVRVFASLHESCLFWQGLKELSVSLCKLHHTGVTDP